MDYKLLLLLLPLFLIIYFCACRFDDNTNKYSRENIKLEFYDEKYVYIKIEEKMDILLDHNLTQDKIKEFEDWLDFFASLPIPGIESVIKLIKIYIKKVRK